MAVDPSVKLYFQGSPIFSSLPVTRQPHAIQTKITELWEPVIGRWFTEGAKDPRITVIKVVPVKGYYWDNKHGNDGAGAKMMIGAMRQDPRRLHRGEP